MKASFVDSLQYLDVVDNGLSTYPPVAPAYFDGNTAQRSLQNSLELFEMADQLGFDWVSLTEHHYSPRQLTPNPLLLAAAIIKHVPRVKIAILGSTIPLLNPVRVAEEYAMLDLLTHGRIIVGLIRGTAPEYVTYGTNPAESRGRYEEGVELILKAWTEPQPFGWEGEYYRFRTVAIWPQPIQQPHPPVFISANSPESVALAARHRLGMALSFQPIPRARKLVDMYNQASAEAGWQPTADHVIVRGFVYVTDTDEQARQDCQTYAFGHTDGGRGLSASVRQAIAGGGVTTLRAAEDLDQSGVMFCGNPDTVATHMRLLREEVGAGILDCICTSGRMPRARVRKSMQLFAKEVLPQVHDL